MQKLISLTLCLSLFATMLLGCNNTAADPADSTPDSTTPATSAETEQVNSASDFEYEENSSKKITITGYEGAAKNVVIPEQIDGRDVTQIGKGAFWAHGIVSVTIPDTVTVIDAGAFHDCQSLETVVMSENVRRIENGAFENCYKISSITLPQTLTVIGAGAFRNCTSLKHITIPKSVNTWDDETFTLSGLETVEIENGVSTIGISAFAGTKIKEVVLPESIRTVSFQAFGGCSELESVTLNEGLVTIDDNAFGGKSKLTEIIIPKSVESITEWAFHECSSLEKVKFEGNAPEMYVDENLEEEFTVIPAEGETLPPDYSPYRANNVNYTVYYHKGAEGFTSPEWFGYETALW